MSAHDPERPAPAGGASADSPELKEQPGIEVPAPSRRPWRWALAAGLVAGLIAWLGGEWVRRLFPSALSLMTSPYPTREMVLAMVAVNVNLASSTFGLLGAVLGLALGLAGGMARRSPRAALVAALVGLVLGGAAGVGLTRAVLPSYLLRPEQDHSDLLLPLLVHGGIWSALGATGGLAFGVGLGGWRRALRAALGGLIGACVGTLAYELTGALAFPLAETEQPISKTMGTRLLARLLVALLAAMGAALAVEPKKTSPHPPT